jgi:hypothetical protein
MALLLCSEEEKPRKQRASRPKVRTGCVTCKYGPQFPVQPISPYSPLIVQVRGSPTAQ